MKAYRRKWKCICRETKKDEVVWNLEGNINEVWNRAVNPIKCMAVDIVYESKGSLKHNKVTWSKK